MTKPMAKPTRNKKGKRPLCPQQGPDGRWLAPSPESEDLPNNEAAMDKAPSANRENEAPVMTTGGGLVTIKPAPHPHSAHTPEKQAINTAAVHMDGEPDTMAQQHPS